MILSFSVVNKLIRIDIIVVVLLLYAQCCAREHKGLRGKSKQQSLSSKKFMFQMWTLTIPCNHTQKRVQNKSQYIIITAKNY